MNDNILNYLPNNADLEAVLLRYKMQHQDFLPSSSVLYDIIDTWRLGMPLNAQSKEMLDLIKTIFNKNI